MGRVCLLSLSFASRFSPKPLEFIQSLLKCVPKCRGVNALSTSRARELTIKCPNPSPSEKCSEGHLACAQKSSVGPSPRYLKWPIKNAFFIGFSFFDALFCLTDSCFPRSPPKALCLRFCSGESPIKTTAIIYQTSVKASPSALNGQLNALFYIPVDKGHISRFLLNLDARKMER